MAETKTTVKTDDGKVELYVPREPGSSDHNLLISVNGVNYLLPRGKTSRVPSFVKREYERAQRATERYIDTENELLKNAEGISEL